MRGLQRAIKTGAKVALAPLARMATGRWARVLMYHRFGPGDPNRRLSAEALDRQLRYLRRHFNVVPLRDLVERLAEGRAPEPRSVALTVDDAYADFGEHAYPVFRRHGVPVTIYVVSQFAGGRFWLWWDAIRHTVARAERGTYRMDLPDGPLELALHDAQSRDEAWSALAAVGVTLEPSRRDAFVLAVQDAFSVLLPASPTAEYAALSWSELRSLDADIVEVGAHTRTHPILALCDSARIADEVSGSKAEIESQLGRRVRAFCYPNGEPQDVDERCVEAVRAAGFDSAVLACGGMIRAGANRYLLERLGAPHDEGEFEGEVSGIGFLRQRIAG
jgi:peptidoglycan/xylan/chitin deacetylase (PgdA/CDA1 family)